MAVPALLRRWLSYWPSALVALMSGVAGLAVHDARRQQLDHAERLEVRQALAAAQSRLAIVAESTFNLSAGLASVVRTDGGITSERFARYVEVMQADRPQLRNVVVAPGDVIQMVHPLEGNEKALGLDYRKVPAQWQQLEKIRASGQPLIFAPVKLIQGGHGIIQRNPIFLGTSERPSYWGSVSLVADVERFMTQARLDTNELRLGVFTRTLTQAVGDPIWTHGGTLSPEAEQLTIRLPGAEWVLLGEPKLGWRHVSAWTDWTVVGALGGGLLLTLMSLALSRRRLQLVARNQALADESEKRRAALAEVEAARARFEGLVALSSDWLWEQDAEGRFTFVSQGLSDSMSSLQQVIGQHRWDSTLALPGVDWEAHKAVYARREAFRDFEYRMRGPNDDVLYVSISGSPVYDNSNRFVGYRGTGRDMTAIRKTEAALAEARDRLQELFDAAVDVAIIATDTEDRITVFNRGAERLLGWSAAEVIGRNPQTFFKPEEVAQRAAELTVILGREITQHDAFTAWAQVQGSDTQTWTMCTREGRELTVSLSISKVRAADGCVTGFLGIAVDLTAQHAAEAAKRQGAQLLQAMFDSAVQVGFISTDLKGRINLFSPGAEQILGCKASQVLGTQSRRFHPQAEVQAEAERLSAVLNRPVPRWEVFERQADGLDGGHHRVWTYHRIDTGAPIQVSHTLTRLHDAHGADIGFLVVVVDISQRLQAEAALKSLNTDLERRVQERTTALSSALTSLQHTQDELIRSEKMAALGSLVAGVAHELNTPIGTGMTAASTLDDRTRDTVRHFEAGTLRKSDLSRYLGDATEACRLLLNGLRNAADLVSHFKQVSADQTSEQRRRFALQGVVDDVLSVLRPQLKHSRIELAVDIDLGQELDAYPGALGQLLTNLILNANLHAFEGVERPRLWLSARLLDPGWFELQVQDNGVGMSEEVRRRAFDPFFTTKIGQGGTGLGLNIVYNIATGVLGGHVELKSEPGQGSCFRFRLPLVAPQQREVAGAMRAG
ncbi:PAS domain S-box protein [Inhella gelatinilytica]|uniref:histidine kinase n=1 Tax=Inhella gelatinilytica TaxID=2795030 RepID=A0A931NDC3_9BURK|nr:PAS domain S-box protein [Inhella gelatinilytica]MBH9552932.1 PAS domain S-box protein [Inhella gelatinilytica]